MLFHSWNFASVMNHSTNIWDTGYLICYLQGVSTHILRTTALECLLVILNSTFWKVYENLHNRVLLCDISYRSFRVRTMKDNRFYAVFIWVVTLKILYLWRPRKNSVRDISTRWYAVTGLNRKGSKAFMSTCFVPMIWGIIRRLTKHHYRFDILWHYVDLENAHR